MKLSEAIREGAKVTKPYKGTLWPEEQTYNDIKDSCALGAALVAGMRSGRVYITSGPGEGLHARDGQAGNQAHVPVSWGWPLADKVECPDCDREGLLINIIAHLNDDHDWTREAIADWVSTYEEGGAPEVAIKTHEELPA